MLVLYGCNINKIPSYVAPAWVKGDNFEDSNVVKIAKKAKKNKKVR